MDNDRIIKARYHLTVTENDLLVDTEGWVDIKERNYPEQLEESFVIQYIKEDTQENGECAIEIRAKQQLEALKVAKPNKFPWSKPTFTIGV